MKKSLKVKSELREIEKVRRFLQKTLKELDLSEESFFLIELSILEMCINIVRYAYPEANGEISIKIWYQAGELYFEIRDWGIPFNPEKINREPPSNIFRLMELSDLEVYALDTALEIAGINESDLIEFDNVKIANIQEISKLIIEADLMYRY